MDAKYPRAILHIDGDAFFVSCEIACNPALAGKPVVTGADRRIVSALSYEAKSIGVRRGMPIHEVKKHFPQVIIIPSHYRLYEIFSRRMYNIVRRFTPIVEWYSIDECFADLTGLDQALGRSYEEIAEEVKRMLFGELGLTFSVGLAPTKVLAKVASRWTKPDGLTKIPLDQAGKYLEKFEIGKVWGIGRQTNLFLSQFGIFTAQDFVDKGRGWIEENCGRNVLDIWYELSGQALSDIRIGRSETPKSFSSTETFLPLSANPTFIFSELSRHAEEVARKARLEGLSAKRISFFVKTSDFRYRRSEAILAVPTVLPNDFVKAMRQTFGGIFDPSIRYRAAGVTIFDLIPISRTTKDLFDQNNKETTNPLSKVYEVVDEIIRTHGRQAIKVCSSLASLGRRPKGYQSLSIPILGRVN